MVLLVIYRCTRNSLPYLMLACLRAPVDELGTQSSERRLVGDPAWRFADPLSTHFLLYQVHSRQFFSGLRLGFPIFAPFSDAHEICRLLIYSMENSIHQC